MTKSPEYAKLLLKIANAMDRGTLPKSLHVNYDGGHVDISAARPTRWSDGHVAQMEAETKVLAWLEQHFALGHLSHLRTVWTWKQRGAGRRRHYLDLKRREFAHGVITMEYHVEHEHGSKRQMHGIVRGDTGAPMWLCNDCSHVVPDAEARKMGLIP